MSNDDPLSRYPELNNRVSDDATQTPANDPLSRYPELSAPLSSPSVVLDYVQDKAGDEQAEIVDISRRRGLPLDMVDGSLDVIRAQDRDATLRGSPATSSFLNDESHARLAADDIPALSRLEQSITGNTLAPKAARLAVRSITNVFDWQRDIIGGAGESVAMGTSGIGDGFNALGNVLTSGLDVVLPESADRFLWLQEDSPQWIKRVEQVGRYVGPGNVLADTGEAAKSAMSVVKSPEYRRGFDNDVAQGLGFMAGQIGVSVATGGTGGTAMLVGQGADQMADRQQESGAFGQSGVTDDLAIIAGGGVTAALEKLGLDQVMGKASKFLPEKVKSGIGAKVLDVLGAAGVEATTEAAEGVVLSGIEKVTTNADAKLFDGIGSDATLGGTVGGIARAIVLAALPGQNRASSRTELDALQEVAEGVKITKLGKRDKPSMANFLRQVGAVGEVYLPAADAVALYQSENDFADAWDISLDEINDAIALGVDVAVPAADFLAKANDANFSDLSNIVRTAPDRMNEIELANEELQAAINSDVEEQFKKQIADTDIGLGIESAKTDVRAKLEAAGKSPEVAENMATLWGAFFETLASKGLDPKVIYDRLGLNVQTPDKAVETPWGDLDLMIEDIKKGVQIKETDAYGPAMMDYIKDWGIKDDVGDIAAMDPPKGLLREDGRELDDIGVALYEDGYFQEIPSRSELLEAIADEMAGQGPKLPDGGDPVLRARLEAMRDLESVMDAAGLDYTTMDASEVAKGVQEYAQGRVAEMDAQIANNEAVDPTEYRELEQMANGGGDFNHTELREFTEALKSELNLRDLSLFYLDDSSIEIHMIAVQKDDQGGGRGSEAMERIVDFADERGLRVSLTTGQRDDGFGTTSSARLKKFYKRFGFVENKGRNKDFSISGNMYREPVQGGGDLFQSAQQDFGADYDPKDPMASAAFREWAGEGAVYLEYPDELDDFDFSTATGPVVFRSWHGTTHDFEAFDASVKGNKEGHFGAVNYFTTNKDDATQNYGADGPDLTTRIEQKAERFAADLEDQFAEKGRAEVLKSLSRSLKINSFVDWKMEARDDADAAYEAGKILAERSLKGGDSKVIEVFIRTEKPFVVNSEASPFVEFVDFEQLDKEAVAVVADDEGLSVAEIEAAREEYEDQIDEARWDIKAEKGNLLIDAIQSVADEYDVDASELMSVVRDFDSEGARQSDIEKYMRESEAFSYIEDPETGDLISSHVIGQIIRNMGFDAIILKNADSQFKNMNMGRSTAHTHVFDQNNTNIKSVNNRGTFDPDDARILYQGASGDIHASNKALADRLFVTGVYPEFSAELILGVVNAVSKNEHYSATRRPFGDGLDEKSATYAGTARLVHGAESDLTEFGSSDSVDSRARYDGGNGSFGSNTYFSKDVMWVNMGGLGHAHVIEADVTFKNAAVLTPKTVKKWRKKYGKDALQDGRVLADALKADGYDGLIVDGFEALKLDRNGVPLFWRALYGDPSKELKKLGVSDTVGQDQVVAFYPETQADVQTSSKIADFKKRIESEWLAETGDENAFFQRGQSRPAPDAEPENPRASVMIPSAGVLSDTDVVVRLMEAEDKTSFLHESAHIFLEIYEDLALENEQIAQELAAIHAWLGNTGERLTRDQHEKFAEGFETYLMEGKAPNVELRAAFVQFKAWFTRVYKHIRNLRIRLDADSRVMFDRMLATESQIDAARAADSFQVSQEFLDMMEPDAAERYKKDVDAAREEAASELLAKHLSTLTRESRAERRKFRADIRGEVSDEVSARPVYAAHAALTSGDLKLDRDEVVRLRGPSFLKKMMRGREAVYTTKNNPDGADPDAVAMMFGFASGDELILALATNPPLKDAIASEIETRVRAEFGDPENDGTIERDAAEVVYNDPQGRVLQAEQAVLAKKALARPMPLAQIKAVALAFVEGSPSRAVIKPGLNAHYSNLAAKRALQFAAKEKWADALRAKQQQQLNHELARLGWKAKAEVESIERFLKRFDPRQKLNPKTIDAEYINTIRKLLALPGQPNQKAARDELLKIYDDAVTAGDVFHLPAALFMGKDLPSLSEMSLSELRDFRDGVKSLNRTGRNKSEVAKAKRAARAEADAVIIRAGWGNKALKLFSHGKKTKVERAKELARKGDAQILRYPFLIKALQGGMSGDLINDLETALRQKLTDRNSRRAEMDEAFFEIMTRHGIDTKELRRTMMVGEIAGTSVTFEQVFSIALNMGTAEGADRVFSDPKMAQNADEIRAMLDRHMEKRHWDAAQEVWDLLGTLWPDAQAVEKRVTGVELKGVDAIPVQTKFGAYAGGYYPIAYNHEAIDNKRIKESSQEDKWKEMTAGVTTRAKTPQGHLIARQKNVSRPLNLNITVALNHIDDATNDIYMREVALKINDRINHDTFQAAVAETHGQEYLRTLETVLKRTVAGTERVTEPFDALIRTARVNAAMAILGYKVTTAALAPVSYFQTVIPLYGKRVVLSGLASFFGKGPIEMVKLSQFINEKSSFMRERNALITREAHEMVRKSKAESGWDKFRSSGYLLMTGIEKYTVSGPLWLGVYHDALDRGLSDADAVTEADRSISMTQGSGLEIDQSIMQGDVETKRALTFMWGYMSGYYGTIRNDVVDAEGVRKVWPIAKHFVLLNAISAMMETVVRGEFGDDDDPYVQQLLTRMTRNVTGLVPGLNFLNPYGTQTSIADTAQKISQTAKYDIKVGRELISGEFSGETAQKAALRNAEMFGFAFGFPGTLQGTQALKVYLEDDDPTIVEALITGADND